MVYSPNHSSNQGLPRLNPILDEIFIKSHSKIFQNWKSSPESKLQKINLKKNGKILYSSYNMDTIKIIWCGNDR